MSEDKKGSVFVSYSRRDRDIAERLVARLQSEGFHTLRDLDDILPTEAWRDRLEQLIVEADSIVFLLSPHSARSEVCQWEVEFANSLNKKIAPIVIDDVAGADIPPMLARLNYIFATESDRFDNAVRSLCDALSDDIVWLREHSRLLGLARRWGDRSEPASLLITGDDLRAAEDWANARPASVPAVTAVVLRFVEASRAAERAATEYDRARLLALETTVEPILKERVGDLETEADAMPAADTNAAAADLRMEADTIRNFFAENGRWHPNAADHLMTSDGRGDYMEVYKFPCCGKVALRADRKQPGQFRADGCAGDPRGE